MNITDQACFKKAVEIAPLEWDDAEQSHFVLVHKSDGWRLYVLRSMGFIDREGMDGYPLTDYEAHALLEKHFRKWLGNEQGVWSGGRMASGKLWIDVGITRNEFGVTTIDVFHTEGSTWLECLCLAVIECDKKERGE